MAAVASPEMEAYFEELEQRANKCYELVGRARKAGYDIEDEAEIPRARALPAPELRMDNYACPSAPKSGDTPCTQTSAIRLPGVVFINPL